MDTDSQVKFGTAAAAVRFAGMVPADSPIPLNSARLQANLAMLKTSLKQVFPPQQEATFETLLRQLDRR